MKRSIIGAGLLALAAILTVPAGPASAAPTITVAVTNGGAPGDPTLLDTGPGEQTIDLAVGLSESATNVTVTPSGDGLVFAQPSIGYGNQPPGAFPAQLKVRAAAPGFHTLTVTVTADGAAPAVLVVDRLWAPGDTHLAPTGTLAGQTWAAQIAYSRTDLEGNMIWFLDSDTAAIGNSRGGRPTCSQAPAWHDYGTCVSYAYDATTGLLEIGRAIGVVRPDGIHLAGVGADDNDGGFAFSDRADFAFRLATLPAGKRLAATFVFVNRLPKPSKRARTLTLRKNGTFAISDYYNRPRRGTYELRSRGRLALRLGGKIGTKVETFLAVAGPSGANPKKNGAWMTVFEDEGRTAYTSASLLVPR